MHQQAPQKADVVVVGAGFAGLTAARELSHRGVDVVVLEGRDRVGGRSHTAAVAGLPVDLGGTFVGPTQDAVIGLAAELGCATTPTYHHGKNLINWRGSVRSYSGTVPALSIGGLLNVGRVRWQFARVARGVPIGEPWTAPQAAKLDAMSLHDWLQVGARVVDDPGSDGDHVAGHLGRRARRGVDAARGALRQGSGRAGPDAGHRGGAQQDRFPAGSQQIAVRIAEALGERVMLGTVVTPSNTTTKGSPSSPTPPAVCRQRPS